jgi:hypothetical protein
LCAIHLYDVNDQKLLSPPGMSEGVESQARTTSEGVESQARTTTEDDALLEASRLVRSGPFADMCGSQDLRLSTRGILDLSHHHVSLLAAIFLLHARAALGPAVLVMLTIQHMKTCVPSDVFPAACLGGNASSAVRYFIAHREVRAVLVVDLEEPVAALLCIRQAEEQREVDPPFVVHLFTANGSDRFHVDGVTHTTRLPCTQVATSAPALTLTGPQVSRCVILGLLLSYISHPWGRVQAVAEVAAQRPSDAPSTPEHVATLLLLLGAPSMLVSEVLASAQRCSQIQKMLALDDGRRTLDQQLLSFALGSPTRPSVAMDREISLLSQAPADDDPVHGKRHVCVSNRVRGCPKYQIVRVSTATTFVYFSVPPTWPLLELLLEVRRVATHAVEPGSRRRTQILRHYPSEAFLREAFYEAATIYVNDRPLRFAGLHVPLQQATSQSVVETLGSHLPPEVTEIVVAYVVSSPTTNRQSVDRAACSTLGSCLSEFQRPFVVAPTEIHVSQDPHSHFAAFPRHSPVKLHLKIKGDVRFCLVREASGSLDSSVWRLRASSAPWLHEVFERMQEKLVFSVKVRIGASNFTIRGHVSMAALQSCYLTGMELLCLLLRTMAVQAADGLFAVDPSLPEIDLERFVKTQSHSQKELSDILLSHPELPGGQDPLWRVAAQSMVDASLTIVAKLHAKVKFFVPSSGHGTTLLDELRQSTANSIFQRAMEGGFQAESVERYGTSASHRTRFGCNVLVNVIQNERKDLLLLASAVLQVPSREWASAAECLVAIPPSAFAVNPIPRHLRYVNKLLQLTSKFPAIQASVPPCRHPDAIDEAECTMTYMGLQHYMPNDQSLMARNVRNVGPSQFPEASLARMLGRKAVLSFGFHAQFSLIHCRPGASSKRTTIPFQGTCNADLARIQTLVDAKECIMQVFSDYAELALAEYQERLTMGMCHHHHHHQWLRLKVPSCFDVNVGMSHQDLKVVMTTNDIGSVPTAFSNALASPLEGDIIKVSRSLPRCLGGMVPTLYASEDRDIVRMHSIDITGLPRLDPVSFALAVNLVLLACWCPSCRQAASLSWLLYSFSKFQAHGLTMPRFKATINVIDGKFQATSSLVEGSTSTGASPRFLADIGECTLAFLAKSLLLDTTAGVFTTCLDFATNGTKRNLRPIDETTRTDQSGREREATFVLGDFCFFYDTECEPAVGIPPTRSVLKRKICSQ